MDLAKEGHNIKVNLDTKEFVEKKEKMKKKYIEIEVQVDTEQSIKKVKELAELLEKGAVGK